MQLKLAPYNEPWQWKIIQGEVARRHIANLFFHYISENEFTVTVIDRAYVSASTEKITLDRKAKSVCIEEQRNLTRGEKAARVLGGAMAQWRAIAPDVRLAHSFHLAC